MYKANLMSSSMTTRMVPETNDLVNKLTAAKAMDSAQRRRVQIASDLEREALALERTAITEAKRALTSEEVQKAAAGMLPTVKVEAEASKTMTTAMVLGVLALGVIAASMWVRR
jgi:phage protein D